MRLQKLAAHSAPVHLTGSYRGAVKIQHVFTTAPWPGVQHDSQRSLEQHADKVVHACSEHDSVTEWLR